jgi:hypothetical protein
MNQGYCCFHFSRKAFCNALICCFIVVVLCVSCEQRKTVHNANEGYISYQISYPPEILQQPVSNLLPAVMDFYFSDKELKFKIKGDLNLFSMEFLSRANGDSCFTLFKVINRKMVYPMKDNEMWFLFDNGAPERIQFFPDSVKHISGFKCQLINIHLKNTQSTLNAYVTNEIKVNNALFRSPFGKIEGVPMEFEMMYNGLKYKFKAQKYLPSIGDERMTIPNDYQVSSKNDIRDLLDSIFR